MYRPKSYETSASLGYDLLEDVLRKGASENVTPMTSSLFLPMIT
jgi:hypothetical protein